jgi:hypothetical protein
MPPRLTLDDIQDICLARFMRRETQAEQVRRASHDVDLLRAQGVGWSGLAPSPAPARSADEIHRDARTAHERARAFAADPRGRFLAALTNLEKLGFAKETAAARAAYARGFSDPAAPACPGEIGCALTALARLAAPDARTACLALAELLGASLGLAAE